MLVVALTNEENHAAKYGQLQTDQHGSDDLLALSNQFDHSERHVE